MIESTLPKRHYFCGQIGTTAVPQKHLNEGKKTKKRPGTIMTLYRINYLRNKFGGFDRTKDFSCLFNEINETLTVR